MCRMHRGTTAKKAPRLHVRRLVQYQYEVCPAKSLPADDRRAFSTKNLGREVQ